MSASKSAALALAEALKDPHLQDAQRSALQVALQALRSKRKVDRRADSARLTKETVAALPMPTSGEEYVYDSETPQLAVRCRPGGKVFVVVAWDRARQRTVKSTLGKVDALTPEQARRKAKGIVARVAEGEDVRRPPIEALTFGELIDKWHEEKKHSVRTADELRRKVLTYAGKLAHRRASEVTRTDIGAVHHQIATRGRKSVWTRVGAELKAIEVGPIGIPATADKWAATICAIYAWGLAKGLVADNPASKIQRAYDAKGSERSRYLKGEELVRAWRAIETDSDHDARDVLMLALLTGQRRGNVMSMRWDAIDFDAATWTVDASETKQRTPQTTPLSSQARAILSARAESASGPWVFPGRGVGPLTETRVRQAWARVCIAAKLTDTRIHDLRHTGGSWLASLNISEAIRQRALGHHDPRSAARYGHVQIDPVADAVQRMADAIEGAAKKTPKASVRKLRA